MELVDMNSLGLFDLIILSVQIGSTLINTLIKMVRLYIINL
jgi:hypothetical protein